VINALFFRYLQMLAPQSLLTYAADGRSAVVATSFNSRHIFLRTKAPIRGLRGPASIAYVVQHNLALAGIQAPTNGAHQFRHALATDMLQHGASLAEIGHVLRHRSPETTKIYTSIDLHSLRTLALPWPGGVR